MSKARIITVVSAISFIIILTAVLIHLFMVVEVPEKCHFYNTINITGSHQFENGSHVFENDIFHKEFIKEFDYIMINGTEQIPVEPHLRGCVCEFKTCIRTCKSMNNITIFNVQNEEENVVLDNNNYYGLVGNPCKDSYVTDADDGDTWHFLPDGSILLKTDGKESILISHQYCLIPDKVVGLCADDKEIVDEPFITQKSRHIITTTGMYISIPFLLITFFVYASILELRNLNGKALMCYVVSLIFLYIFLIITFHEGQEHGSLICKFIGYTTFFFSMSCFFWLQIMCYDIWSTFKGSMRGYRKIQDKNRFTVYCLYAFGCAILLTLNLIILDKTSLILDQFRPNMGVEVCWIKPNRTNTFFYIYYPILFILCFNITLYSITAYQIYKCQMETSSLRTGDSKTHSKMNDDKDRFYLYLRLFVLMGVPWVMEFVSFANGNLSIFVIFDLCNCLQGSLIFIMFVCRPRVKKLLFQRYSMLRRFDSSNGTPAMVKNRISVETASVELDSL